MDIIAKGGTIVCGLGCYGEIKPWKPFTNYEANARLIAAAPDLLEACQAMLDEYEAGRSVPVFEIRQIVRAAVAKATEGKRE